MRNGRFVVDRVLLAAVACTVLAPLMPSQAAEPDRAAFTALEQSIRSGEIPAVHGVVAIRGSERLVEWYFEGDDETLGQPLGRVKFDAATLHDMRSVTKSIVSILFGIAHADGAISDLDRPVLDWFPEYADLRTPERLAVRVRHVLTMTSGLRWDERTYPYTDIRNSEIAMDIAEDPYRYVLRQPFDRAPGERFNYSGGDVALVGAIVARATKQPIETFAQARLFGPMGIRFEWSRNRDIARAASGLRLTPLDAAKIGVLMRDGGIHEGHQIVPADWVRQSTSRQVGIEPDAAFDRPECPIEYGYLWWIGPPCAGRPGWFAGFGNGGQRIWVVRDLGAVVVSTAGLYNQPQQGIAATAILRGVLTALPAK